MRSPVLSASDLKNKIVCLHCMFYSAILRKPEYTLSSLSPYHKGIQEKFLARICDLQCDSCLLCKLLKSWIGQRNGRMSLSPILTAAPVRTHSSHWRGQLPNLQVARKKKIIVCKNCVLRASSSSGYMSPCQGEKRAVRNSLCVPAAGVHG